DLPTAPVKFIHHAEREWKLGANDGQVGVELVGEPNDGIQALEIDGQALGFAGDASVAGSAEHRGHARRLAKLPDQSVLAPSAADDQDFHSETDKGMGREEVLSNCNRRLRNCDD